MDIPGTFAWSVVYQVAHDPPTKAISSTKIQAVKGQSVQQYKDQVSVEKDSGLIEKLNKKPKHMWNWTLLHILLYFYTLQTFL